MDAILEPIDLTTTESEPKKRRLTLTDVEQIAKLVARRKLNESEACRALGINPHQWVVYKSRKKVSAIFETLITRIKGLTINHAMERIEIAGNKDWRADYARLGLIDPQRFGQRTEHTGEVKHTHQLSDDSKRKIEAMLKASLQQPVINCQVVEQKQISDCPVSE